MPTPLHPPALLSGAATLCVPPASCSAPPHPTCRFPTAPHPPITVPHTQKLDAALKTAEAAAEAAQKAEAAAKESVSKLEARLKDQSSAEGSAKSALDAAEKQQQEAAEKLKVGLL